MKLNKRNLLLILLLILIVIISTLLFIINRYKIINNELYVKLFSEKMFFNISKHKASRAIIEEYKQTKKASQEELRFIDEGDDYILYANSSDVLRIIYMKDGKVENDLYKPKFSYEIDGKYVHFMFSDNFLPYVDEITICLLGSNIQNELYIIPVSTAQSTYESIIKIEKLDELDVQKINFEIRYSDQINRNWNTKNIVVF